MRVELLAEQRADEKASHLELYLAEKMAGSMECKLVGE